MAPRDDRIFLRLHEGMPEHPKVEGLSDAAFRLLIESWCWCHRNQTDGRIPAASWAKRGTPKARRELIAADLVHETDGAVLMHDYTDHQVTRAEIEATKARNRANGAKGGRPPKTPPPNPDGTQKKPSGFPVANPNGTQNEATPNPDGTQTEPRLKIEAEAQDQNPSLTVVRRLISGDAQATTTDAEFRRWQELAGPGTSLEAEARAFIDRNAFGAPLRDPSAAWIGWLRKAAERAPEARPAPPGCNACTDGWAGEDDSGRPIPCPQCRPRLLTALPTITDDRRAS